MSPERKIFILALAGGGLAGGLAAIVWPSTAQAATGDGAPPASKTGGSTPAPRAPSAPRSGSSTPARAPTTTGSSPVSSSAAHGEMPDSEVYTQIAAGSVPAFLRAWKPVRVGSGSLTGTIFVSPDYLGIGRDASYLRTPMKPGVAQRLADTLGFILPTRKMVEAIEAQAQLVPFHEHSPGAGESHNALRLWQLQNAEIAADIGARAGQLVAGHKKDIVIGAPVGRNRGKVIIFGGRRADGTRVQGQSNAHSASYEDYSHGVRMIRPDMIVTENGVGRGVLVKDALADPRLADMLSDEGATTAWRYET